jgi:hypothetical protein
MNRIVNFILVVACCRLLIGCTDNSVNSSINNLTLTVESVTCTEAILKIALAPSETQRVLTLSRGNSTIAAITLSGSDTVFIDDGVLPSKTYTYSLASARWNAITQITTMDTTSHNWSWEVDKLGIANSYLYDVAIVNDTLAYAGGIVYLNDSTGKFDQQSYCIAVWSGHEWRLKKLYDSDNYLIPNLRGVLAFSSSDVWLTDGGAYRWNGMSPQVSASFSRLSLIGGVENGQSINKLWGTSSSNIYGVGYAGMVAHYSANVWTKVTTNLTTEIHDVWGGSNPAVGNNVVLSNMCNKYYYGDARVLRLSAQGILDSIRWGMQLYPPYSVWFNSTSQVYVCGGGIFRLQNGAWVSMANGLPAIFANRIRGNGDNDLVVAGDFGIVAHYNGVSWQVYDQLRLPNGNYESIAIRNNLAIAVGWYNGQGYIAIGRR